MTTYSQKHYILTINNLLTKWEGDGLLEINKEHTRIHDLS